MTNFPREYEIGGVYHIFNRGYDKRQIFFDANDHFRFIDSLYYFNDEQNIKLRDMPPFPTGQTGVEDKRSKLVEILAFVQMKNHFHLILREIKENGISTFMRKLGNGFTGFFNTKYNRLGLGGLFQSRYKSVSIKTDAQLEATFAYVHTNPIEIVEPGWKEFKVNDPKKAVEWLNEYKWSSWNDYLGKDIFTPVLSLDFYMSFCSGTDGCKSVIDNWIKYKAQDYEDILPF